MGPIVIQVLLQLSHENGLVTMVSKFNTSCFYVDWCKFYIHLRYLNILHFRMVGVAGLKL
jgi:hypothetical protein